MPDIRVYEDIVQLAFNRFFAGVDKGLFPQLADRDDLWKVLVMLTARQSINEFHRQTAQKRGGGQVRGESVFAGNDGPVGIDQVVGSEPQAVFVDSVMDNIGRWLKELPDANLREIAQQKMEGKTNRQIAADCRCSERTIERKIKLIRTMWAERIEQQETT